MRWAHLEFSKDRGWCTVDQIRGRTLRWKIMWHYPFRAPWPSKFLTPDHWRTQISWPFVLYGFRRRSLVRSCRFSQLDRWKKRSCASTSGKSRWRCMSSRKGRRWSPNFKQRHQAAASPLMIHSCSSGIHIFNFCFKTVSFDMRS